MYCDLVQCYKIVYKLVDLPMEDVFLIDFNYHNLWGHSFKLKPVGSLSVYSCRHNFFSQRFIKVWNSLYHQMLLKPQVPMPSSHAYLKLTYQVFVKCIISSREYISACTCHYLPQCTFCTCKSINQSKIHTIITEKLHLCTNTILLSLKFALSIAQQSHGNQTDKSHMIPSKMIFK